MIPADRSPPQFPAARILIFAKAPEPGLAKTRLIPALGAEGAAEFHAQLLESTVRRFAAAGIAPLQCWCTPDLQHPLFQHLALEYGVELALQRGADLGERMCRAASEALTEVDAVVLVGGDCPILGPEHLAQTLTWLGQGEDAVLGPAEDGGYVLLGLNRVDSRVFSDIPWGGDRVAALTRQRLRQLDWHWQELLPLWDLDRPDDLRRYQGLA
jgi:rSAM/selenodomain-associated transferase 1